MRNKDPYLQKIKTKLILDPAKWNKNVSKKELILKHNPFIFIKEPKDKVQDKKSMLIETKDIVLDTTAENELINTGLEYKINLEHL
jgi:hypothetical protein